MDTNVTSEQVSPDGKWKWDGTQWIPNDGDAGAGFGEAVPVVGVTPEAAKRKRWPAYLLGGAAALLVIAIAMPSDDASDTPAQADDSAAAAPADPVSEDLVAEGGAPTAPSVAGDGIFEVGVDIKPGLYRAEGNGYWERLKNAEGDLDSIIANDNANGQAYVQIAKSDAYFSTSGMSDWVLVDPKAGGEQATSFAGGGTFMVGVDIKPGTYKSTGDGYWQRSGGASGTLDDIIANDNPTANAIVEIQKTDKFFSTSGMGEWVRAT